MTIRAEGTLARFALENGRLAESVVKPKLFEPNRHLALSVFHAGGIGCHEIIDLGMAVTASHPTARRLHGWAEIEEGAVTNTGLRVDYDDSPPRHANIVGWPADRGARKGVAIALASAARAVKLNAPVDASGHS